MQIRQARPAQRPARLLNNALDDAGSLNLGEDEDRSHGQAPVAVPPPVAMLPGEHRIRFWLKERSLLAVALHVKPGMTRAAEFLVPVQLCNRALSARWPAGEKLSRLLCNASGNRALLVTWPAAGTLSCTATLAYSADVHHVLTLKALPPPTFFTCTQITPLMPSKECQPSSLLVFARPLHSHNLCIPCRNASQDAFHRHRARPSHQAPTRHPLLHWRAAQNLPCCSPPCTFIRSWGSPCKILCPCCCCCIFHHT